MMQAWWVKCKNMDIVSSGRHVFIFCALQIFSHKLHKEVVDNLEGTGRNSDDDGIMNWGT